MQHGVCREDHVTLPRALCGEEGRSGDDCRRADHDVAVDHEQTNERIAIEHIRDARHMCADEAERDHEADECSGHLGGQRAERRA
jgi:hypothetical protein